MGKMDDIFKEAQAAVSNEADLGPAVEETVEVSVSSSDSELDVPSYLDTIDSDGTSEQPILPENPTKAEIEEYLSYKSNGQEFKATKAEAQKALELMKGARRAFSDRSKLQRELEALKKDLPALQEFKAKWEKALANGDDVATVLRNLTGQDPELWVDQKIRERQRYSNATPEERKAMDLENELKNTQKKIKEVEEQSSKRYQDAEEREFNARVRYMQSIAEPAYEKHAEKFDSLAPAAANKLKKMLWLTSIRDLQDYKKQGHEPTKKLMEKVFSENASALMYNVDEQKKQTQQAQHTAKAQVAQASAQAASAKNYSGDADSLGDLVKLNPLELFSRLRRK